MRDAPIALNFFSESSATAKLVAALSKAPEFLLEVRSDEAARDPSVD
jgi:hypothetical protein